MKIPQQGLWLPVGRTKTPDASRLKKKPPNPCKSQRAVMHFWLGSAGDPAVPGLRRGLQIAPDDDEASNVHVSTQKWRQPRSIAAASNALMWCTFGTAFPCK